MNNSSSKSPRNIVIFIDSSIFYRIKVFLGEKSSNWITASCISMIHFCRRGRASLNFCDNFQIRLTCPELAAADVRSMCKYAVQHLNIQALISIRAKQRCRMSIDSSRYSTRCTLLLCTPGHHQCMLYPPSSCLNHW